MLCAQIGERRVGSASNRDATDYVQRVLSLHGWSTETTQLSVMDWQTEGATLKAEKVSFDVFASPYALGCSVEGILCPVDSFETLKRTTIEDKILLLYGDIAMQQIAPKHFPFWNPEEHQQLISILEKGCPKALICATERNAATAGGVYPFPMFEDGDFDIPSVYMKDTEGEKLRQHAGQTVELISLAKRIPETAFNVIAKKPNQASNKRLVISAHIDTKIGTPGAIDNATGVTVLLLLAELLKNSRLKHTIELVFFNGEDYYAAPGQLKYMEQKSGAFGDIALNINIDGAGYKTGLSCFSPFRLDETQSKALQAVLLDHPNLVEGLPWYQGDHSMFLQQGCPAIAVSSQWFIEHMEVQDITHTPKDNLNIVDFERVADCAIGIAAYIDRLEKIMQEK